MFSPLILLALTALVGGGSMTVAVSSHAPAAKSVKLTVTLRYEMQCGYPGEIPVRLTLPGRLGRAVALVNGKPARATVRAHVLTVDMPPKPEILCDVIGPGRLTITVPPRAGLRNPPSAGTYTVTARKEQRVFTAPFTVR
ncbi:MAG TPA: hypothetical protein VGQ38_08295 [Gaiellaceae bacterium]|nr:hypothetical protein [Gaiellaceae bacterium]